MNAPWNKASQKRQGCQRQKKQALCITGPYRFREEQKSKLALRDGVRGRGGACGTRKVAEMSGYDYALLRALLLRHGFEDVVRIDDDLWHLNVIATRPAR